MRRHVLAALDEVIREQRVQVRVGLKHPAIRGHQRHPEREIDPVGGLRSHRLTCLSRPILSCPASPPHSPSTISPPCMTCSGLWLTKKYTASSGGRSWCWQRRRSPRNCLRVATASATK